MEQNGSEVYNLYTSIKNAGRFDFSSLHSLFSMNRQTHTWDDSILLQTVVHNISLGRPTWPTLVDAIVAERSHDNLKTLYQYSIEEFEITNPKCFRFRVLILPHESTDPFGSFEGVMCAPEGNENTRGWYVQRIQPDSMEVFNIAEPGFTTNSESKERFSSYTIFDNLTIPVELDKMGTLYLQCLEEQVEQFSGGDAVALFHRFRAYADCMLEMHPSYRLWVRYVQVGTWEVRLHVGVLDDDARDGRWVVQYNEILKKVR